MRSAEDRDEQTLAIATAVLLVVLCLAVGGLAVWLVDRAVGVGEAGWPVVLVVSLGVGGLLAVRHLRGR